MLNRFKDKAKEQFIEYSHMWVEYLGELFPDDAETQDVIIYLQNVVKHSPSQIEEQLKSWMRNMNTPLDVKKTKYAKAIERLTKHPAVIYHALMYRDADALRHCIDSAICERLNIFDKYDKVDADQKAAIWKFMEKISHAAYEASEQAVPVVPTRAEIQENIRSRKEKRTEDGPSMTRAFQTHINALCRLIGDKEVLDAADEETIRDFMVRWNDFAKESTDGQRHSSLCQQNDAKVLEHLVAKVPELASITGCSMDEKIWRNINQLNGFSTVAENIPTKMMGRIEDVANKLADDIVAGRTDMASVNLSDIGQRVLAGCDEEDMSKFAENIEELLPALQNFQR